ncbi:hypothetical protein B0T21DRAFT_411497 [Apiosordaria backusii]|uniref:Major facilitator superfamily (MFS) profile domain-containing protein n=1 Tax=Apiosordaria backusii TaxID=314023 RepID=A0AA40EG47_9PEZI|nr:hypothetical protein B0T21DRAFT_411497 [Apiosordaria backusii]
MPAASHPSVASKDFAISAVTAHVSAGTPSSLPTRFVSSAACTETCATSVFSSDQSVLSSSATTVVARPVATLARGSSSIKEFPAVPRAPSPAPVPPRPPKRKCRGSCDAFGRQIALGVSIVFAMISGILFGYDSGYINGVMAMDYFDNLHLSYAYRGNNSVVCFPNKTLILDRGDAPIHGPISITKLYAEIQPAPSDIIAAAFGYNNSEPPPWLLLDRKERPFWTEGYRISNSSHRQPDGRLPPRPRWFHLPGKDKLKLVGALSLGTFFGSFAGSDLADWVGRRTVLLLGAMCYTVGVLDQYLSNEINWLARGRFEAGVGMGAISAVVVVYLVETSRSDWREWLVMIYQIAITLGMLISSGVTFNTMSRWDTTSYQVPIVIQFLWVGLLSTLLLFLPESPRWCVKTGQVDRARHILSWLTRKPLGDEELEAEVSGMLDEVKRDRKRFGWAQESPLGHSCEYTLRRSFFESWSCCWWGKATNPGSHFRRTLLATMIMVFQQLIGVNIVFYFAVSVFKQHKFDSNPFVLALILASVNVLSTLVCCYPVMDLRRRVLLIGGAMAMAICQLTVGVTAWAWYWTGDNKTAEHSPTWLKVLTVVGMSLYVFFFASSWGPGAWILIGEIFPTQIRARAVGIATAANWATNSLICYLMPMLIEPDGRDIGLGVFTITGTFSILAAAYVYYCVPETEGKTLEELAYFFAHGVGHCRRFAWEAPESAVRRLAEIDKQRYEAKDKEYLPREEEYSMRRARRVSMFASMVHSRKWTTFKHWVAHSVFRTKPEEVTFEQPKGSFSSASPSIRTSVNEKTIVISESLAAGLEEAHEADTATPRKGSLMRWNWRRLSSAGRHDSTEASGSGARSGGPPNQDASDLGSSSSNPFEPGYEMATAAHQDTRDASSEGSVSPCTLIPSSNKKKALSW